jgi:two-component system, NtrC family, response regulator AtoC
MLELAHGGTLVVDEPPPGLAAVMARLGRALDLGTTQRAGGEPTPCDARLVVTTSETPAAFLAASPLAPRLRGSFVVIPPLRDRVDDIPAMASRVLLRSAMKYGRRPRSLADDAIAQLAAYPWPGNVAELGSVIERAVLRCEGDVLSASLLALGAPMTTAKIEPSEGGAHPIDLPGQLDELERKKLCAALDQCSGNKAEVARVLGIQRTTLYYRLKRLGIEV